MSKKLKKVGFSQGSSLIQDQIQAKLDRKSVLYPENEEEKEEMEKSAHLIKSGKNKIFKAGMTITAMR